MFSHNRIILVQISLCLCILNVPYVSSHFGPIEPQVIHTQNDLQYRFFQVTNGYIAFKVKAAYDAHITLAAEPRDADPMAQIFLGTYGNTRTFIAKNRSQIMSVRADTPSILNREYFRGFWLKWNSGFITLGREHETIPFLAWFDPAPFPVSFYGFSTTYGSTGLWDIEGGPTFETPDELVYSNFVRPMSGWLSFDFKGPHNCHIALTRGPNESDPMYEFILGGWENTMTVLRYSRKKPDVVEIPTTGIVNASEYKRFLIEWNHGRLILRKGDGNILIDWFDPNPFPVTHFGIRTGWNGTGEWRFLNSQC